MTATETAALAANVAEWVRYTERQVRAAERRVESRTLSAERYLAGRTLAELTESDLDNYARALQDLRVTRRDLDIAVEARDAARDLTA
jgi:hypothetical protein